MKLLEVKGLDKKYISSTPGGAVHAVDHVSFVVEKGEFLGLVGESGCGKSTIAKMLSGLLRSDSGEILFEGHPLRPPFSRQVYRQLQMIFQLPRDSFDPRWTVEESLVDIQRNFGAGRREARDRAELFLQQVGLDSTFLRRYPHQLSGGECQRVAIARAMAVSPKLLICDEITSALDVSIQAQIVELLQDLRRERTLSVLFISHDLALVQGLCDRILVMHDGIIVEEGPSGTLLSHPKQAYTKTLFSAVFDPDADMNSQVKNALE